MELNRYIDRVINTNKEIFCHISLKDDFDKKNLFKLCTLNIPRERLIIAWSLIIDLVNDNNINDFFSSDVLEFLISNNICLCDLGHLKLSNYYLKKIYEKDNSCWEALKNIDISK